MHKNTTVAERHPWLAADGEDSESEQSSLQLWIARELHDVVVQTVTTTMIELDLGRRSNDGLSPERADALQQDLQGVLRDLRLMMRQLRGQPIESGSLVPTLTTLVAELRSRTGLDVSLRVSPDWPETIAPETTRNLRRIVEEAVRNVVSHSGASAVEIRLEIIEGGLRVSITDDGAWGHRTSAAGTDATGVQGMHERAVIIGGVLTIDRAGPGSTVAVVVGEPDAGRGAS